jgi:hypothetical protein
MHQETNDGKDKENVDEKSCDVKRDEGDRPNEYENESENEERIAHRGTLLSIGITVSLQEHWL